MDKATKFPTIAEIVDEYIGKRTTDWFDLWAIAGRIERCFPTASSAEIKHLALEAVRVLVGRGFRTGNWGELGYRFWPEKNAEATLARISKDWVVAGKNVGW